MSDRSPSSTSGRIEQVGGPPRSTSGRPPSSSRASSARRTSSSATGAASASGPSESRSDAAGEAATDRRRRLRRRVYAVPRRNRPAVSGSTVVQQNDGRTLGRGERVGIVWRDEDAFQLNQRGGQMSKGMLVVLAACAVGLAFPAAGVTRPSGRNAEHDRVGGLHPGAVGEAVREAVRLHGAREVRGLLRRDGDADALRRRRPVRHGLGLRRREPAPDLRPRRAGGRSVEDPRLQELRQDVPVAAEQHGRWASTTASRCSGARTRCSTTRRR